MKFSPIVLAFVVLLASLPTAQATEVLKKLSWSELDEQGQVDGGEVVPATGPKKGDLLKVVNPGNSPKQVRLFELKKPGITQPAYALRGQIRYENVQGPGYLEMWNHFPDGSQYFSRTLGTTGPMQSLNGTSGWRDFTVPFFINQGNQRPSRLVVNLVLPGSGTVELGPIELIQHNKIPPALQVNQGWWNAQTGGWLGGILGTLLGLIGAIAGVLMSRGRARRLVMTMTSTVIIAGIVLLAVGVVALLLGQPHAVWYPLLLGGAIIIGVLVPMRPVIRRRYEQMELQQIAAVDLGKPAN